MGVAELGPKALAYLLCGRVSIEEGNRSPTLAHPFRWRLMHVGVEKGSKNSAPWSWPIRFASA
jgi:hypothetical protein